MLPSEVPWSVVNSSCCLYNCRYTFTPLNTTPMAKSKIELTPAEWIIIKTVWEHEPCAAPAVQEFLEAETQWTYSTVRTLMDRMVAKGLLSAEKIRNLTLYRSVVTRQQAQR